MSLPSYSALSDALLQAMHIIGRPASIDELELVVRRILNIGEADATQERPSGRTELSYRLAWGRTYLKSLGLIRSVERAVWTLTDQGRGFRSVSDLPSIDIENSADLFDNIEGPLEGLDAAAPDKPMPPEGFDGAVPEEFGEYPIDSVLIRQETRTVFEVVRRINDDRFVIPEFQRDFIWDIDRQSKLIESMLMRIPLPVFYLAEREDGKTLIVDGLQRLTTFRNFLKNETALRNLRLAPEINGKKFVNLPQKLQNRLEDTQLILYMIDSKVPEQAKLDIFDRVNGGIPLTRQQMRNSIYFGQATRWLKDAVLTDEFLRATGKSLDPRTMRDRECVNRFCAFQLLGANAYTRGDMDDFLAQVLKEMNRLPEIALNDLRSRFILSMQNNSRIFGDHAFRKHRSPTSRRSVLNVALFDVFSVLLTRLDPATVDTHSPEIRNTFFRMMDNPVFLDAISLSTNSTSKVRLRFEIAESELKDFLNVHGS